MLTTYTELQAAIASRLHRTDLTTQIVDYITIAEKRIIRQLQLTEQETETVLTAVISSRNLTLPTDFSAPIALYLTTYLPRISLEYRLPQDMQVFSDNGPASYWTIDGAVIKTDTPADQQYTYVLRYVASFNIASTSTNSLLTNYPELYLYGALIEAAADVRDNELAQVSATRFAQALQECSDDINANRRIAPLVTELPVSGRSNIISGV